jgi:hypothetical protein
MSVRQSDNEVGNSRNIVLVDSRQMTGVIEYAHVCACVCAHTRAHLIACAVHCFPLCVHVHVWHGKLTDFCWSHGGLLLPSRSLVTRGALGDFLISWRAASYLSFLSLVTHGALSFGHMESCQLYVLVEADTCIIVCWHLA